MLPSSREQDLTSWPPYSGTVFVRCGRGAAAYQEFGPLRLVLEDRPRVVWEPPSYRETETRKIYVLCDGYYTTYCAAGLHSECTTRRQ